ncbi:MAG: hypothetical protein JW839_10805 [Candidatus Lokiarchaeota archaeon]|nr:hypothetical protein [Candidatus Lokiarchaeota archaeon]
MKTIPHSRKGTWRKALGFALIILVPTCFGCYAYSCAESVLQFASYLGSEPVDYGALIPANHAKLEAMSRGFEFYLERDNLPLNYTLTAVWRSDFDAISHFAVGGDAAIWSGMSLAMASFKYAVAQRHGDATEVSNATRLVRKLVDGVSLLLAVPNGGIGPAYPGVLARSVSPKDWSDAHPGIAGYPYGSEADHVDVFDGAGDYSDWFWIGYPSLDQYSGVIMGVTVALAIVDDPYVRSRARLLAAQMVEHFKDTGWNLADGNGRTTGQSFLYSIEHPGYWLLATLFMGTLADPGAYLDLYYHWAIDRGYADYNVLKVDLRAFTLFNYFSMNINWVIFYAMATFESDQALRARYQRVMAECMYPVAANHRNAWYNMAFLHVMGKNDSWIQQDVNDQLMRFGVERIPGQPNSTRLPERGLNASGNYYHDLVGEEWPRTTFSAWLEENPLFPQPAVNPAASLLEEDEYLAKPKTVDQYHSVDFLWQRTPYTASDYSPARRQDSGLAYLLPYWMGRFHGSIPGGE